MDETSFRNKRGIESEQQSKREFGKSELPLPSPNTILEVLTFPNKKLKQEAVLVENITDSTIHISNIMIDTLKAMGGIGLASTQVGWGERVILTNVSGNDPLIIINPSFEPFGKIKVDSKEGCLSLPGGMAVVSRHYEGTVKGIGLDEKEIEFYINDLEAAVIQHEIDHLNGVLFIDHLSKLKRDIVIKKVKKIKKRMEATR